MKNHIYTNGCSFVKGDELQSSEEAFPHLLNGQVFNEAQSGISNQRILRTTLSSGLDWDWYIIGWTSPYRWEYYDGDWISQNPTPPHHFKQMNKKISNQLQWFRDDWFYINFINQVLTLQNYLKFHQKKFFFFLSWDNLNRKDYLEYRDLIDIQTFPSLFQKDMDFKNYTLLHGGGLRPGGHPDKHSHKIWADYLNRIIST